VNVPALPPTHAHYQACDGAWRSPMNIEITDRSMALSDLEFSVLWAHLLRRVGPDNGQR
jgi:hypothetical protein